MFGAFSLLNDNEMYNIFNYTLLHDLNNWAYNSVYNKYTFESITPLSMPYEKHPHTNNI